jgi:purine-binding chemotaxis protein CheW
MTGPYPYKSESPTDVLKARARKLAVEEPLTDQTNHFSVLAFRLAKESYGIELRHVSGVHLLKGLAYIPGAPDFILGIINMRGQILSVVDLKIIFDLGDDASGNSRMVIILKNLDMEFCLAADEIIGVHQIPAGGITASLPTLTDIRSEYLLGISGDGMVILDGKKLLNAPEMRIDIVP